jgi:hypothetical protein
MRCIVNGGSVVKDARVDVIRLLMSSSELSSREGVTAGGIRSSFSLGAKDSRKF